jgi:RHS repeat-associated protein
LKNPFTYKGAYGYYYDEETGLYYLKARYYDPKIYRFISRDPIEKAPELADLQNPLFLNPYLYCEDDPVGKVDPEGVWADIHHQILSRAIARKYGFSAWASYKIGYYAKAIDWWYPAFWPYYFHMHWRTFGCWRWAHYKLKQAIHRARLAKDYKRAGAISLYKTYRLRALKYLGFALHAIQDYYAHISWPWFHRSRWDNPRWKPYRWANAVRMTRKFIWRFVVNCGRF